uniref:Transcription initiation factor TFIID subunit 12 domain-containing protein n=1 Tax=Globisporangium ultimum (strain ATCC 200006 / CBS 805.95 / DAOM BR144) TaxID=431595 RepID=K3WRJ4_GLOUD
MAKPDGLSSSSSSKAKSASSSSSFSSASKANGGASVSSSSGGGGVSSAMTGSEAALKLKNLKGIHEDDGGDDESESGVQLPLDAQVMAFVLESMGAEKHDPRVVNQLQEFVHRYVTEILLDAQEYSLYADKQVLDADDIRLAIASRLNHHYAQLTMELAEKRNSIPLPPISNEYGVRLPPLQYQLVTQEIDRQDRTSIGGSGMLALENADDALMGGDVMSSSRPPLHPQAGGEGSRNKRVARHQIPININQR